jgi:hypothetical protein
MPAVNGYPGHSSYGHLGSSPANDLRTKFQVPTGPRSTAGRVFEFTHTGGLMIKDSEWSDRREQNACLPKLDIRHEIREGRGIFPGSYMRMQELMRIVRLGACLA